MNFLCIICSFLLQFAYCYPYTYSDLQGYLNNITARRLDFVKRELLGASVVGLFWLDATALLVFKSHQWLPLHSGCWKASNKDFTEFRWRMLLHLIRIRVMQKRTLYTCRTYFSKLAVGDCDFSRFSALNNLLCEAKQTTGNAHHHQLRWAWVSLVRWICCNLKPGLLFFVVESLE